MQRLCVSCGGVCDGVLQCVVMVHVVWWCGLCGGVVWWWCCGIGVLWCDVR